MLLHDYAHTFRRYICIACFKVQAMYIHIFSRGLYSSCPRMIARMIASAGFVVGKVGGICPLFETVCPLELSIIKDIQGLINIVSQQITHYDKQQTA